MTVSQLDGLLFAASSLAFRWENYRQVIGAFEKSLEDDDAAEGNLNAVAKKASSKKASFADAKSSPKEDVLARAAKANPNRGRYWAPARKDFQNWRDSVEETTLKVLAKMESEGEFSS